MNKLQEKHIEQFGKERFHKLLVLANMEVRKDRRLVGLDKIRSEIAHTAALQASGFNTGLVLSRRCGVVTVEIERIASEVLAKALAAAKA